jgi:phytoene synthase
LLSALSAMRRIAREHLSSAERHIALLPASLKPAFLPLALVAPVLNRMDRAGYDPFRARDLPAWRRQWILWRAARRM